MAAGDAAALVAFAAVGLAAHDEGLAATAFARTAGPLLAGWFAAAAATRLYRRPSLRALVTTWAVGVPAGVALRALLLGRGFDSDQVAFLLTTLAVSLALVAAVRILVALRAPRTA